VRRWLCLLLAGVFFALAAFGAFLPGLPSTPFLLITSYFLVRSSPALHARLRRSRRFGPLLDNWERHRALSRRTKLVSLAASTLFVALTLLFAGLPLAVKGAILLIWAFGFFYVFRIPVV